MEKRFKELQLAGPSILARVIHDVADDVQGFREITKGKHFQKRILPYEDTKGNIHLSLTLVYLQDYFAPLEGLDEKVVEAVRSSLERQKLKEVVNDVVVNLHHFRDDVQMS